MVKYSFNAGWRGRDAAYNNALRALLGVLFPLAAALHAFRRKKRGRPARVTPAKALILLVAKQVYHAAYRELAARRDILEPLGLWGIHYTTIQKAVRRLPIGLLEAAILSLALAVVKEPITAAIDSTGFGTHVLVKEIRAMREVLEHVSVKLHALYDAERLVFLTAAVTGGEAADSPMLKPLLEAVIGAVAIARLLADPAYSSRENIQLIADLGIEPIIMPKESSGGLAKGYPAWRRLVLEFMELGAERWIKEKGYGMRLTSEGIFSALKLKFGGALSSRMPETWARELLARVAAHNLHTLAALL